MTGKDFWPLPEAFLDISLGKELSDGRACCVSVALCDANGMPRSQFTHGEEAHFFFEFEALRDLECPSGSIEIRDYRGITVYGKESFHFGHDIQPVKAGQRIRFHHAVKLEIRPGRYCFNAGLSESTQAAYGEYKRELLSHEAFGLKVSYPCLMLNAGTFGIRIKPHGKILHLGVANLPSQTSSHIFHNGHAPASSKNMESLRDGSWPTLFHVTHWKAGSQWIAKILQQCAQDRVVPAQLENSQFRSWPIQQGKIYSAVYVTKEEFEAVPKPEPWRHFVVIRDLRDTLVSAYFSFQKSHPVLDHLMAHWRHELERLDFEGGMVFLMREWLPGCAAIQLSWLESGFPVIDYDDLLTRDEEILEKVLLQDCGFPIAKEKLREAIINNRFESLTGRLKGEEDVLSHERKGISGDWQNHFTEKLKKAFKARFGGILVAAGHEKDLSW